MKNVGKNFGEMWNTVKKSNSSLVGTPYGVQSENEEEVRKNCSKE